MSFPKTTVALELSSRHVTLKELIEIERMSAEEGSMETDSGIHFMTGAERKPYGCVLFLENIGTLDDAPNAQKCADFARSRGAEILILSPHGEAAKDLDLFDWIDEIKEIETAGILTKPEHGWCNINMGTFCDRCSYLDDVPVMLMDAAKKVLLTNAPASVRFDAEGYEYIITLDSYEQYANGRQCLDKKIEDVARMIAECVTRDLDGWAGWFSYEEADEKRIGKRKDMLLRKAREIDELSRMPIMERMKRRQQNAAE